MKKIFAVTLKIIALITIFVAGVITGACIVANDVFEDDDSDNYDYDYEYEDFTI